MQAAVSLWLLEPKVAAEDFIVPSPWLLAVPAARAASQNFYVYSYFLIIYFFTLSKVFWDKVFILLDTVYWSLICCIITSQNIIQTQ